MSWNERHCFHRAFRRVAIVILATLWTTGLYAQSVDPWNPNDNSFEGYIAREPLKREADALASKFIAAAIAKDKTALLGIVSPETMLVTGRENLERYLDQSVLPFFADHKDFGRSATISTARDARGNVGFAFYRYSVRTNGEKKPFAIFVLWEGGQWYVANILIDQFVPDRHRPDEQ